MADVKYVNSTKITAFPAVNRNIQASGDVNSGHTTEHSYSSMTRNLIDRQGYVFSPELPKIEGVYARQLKLESGNWVGFNVGGYFFNVDFYSIIATLGPTELPSDKSVLYACISISGTTLKELSGQDVMVSSETQETKIYEYRGVGFEVCSSGTEPSSSTFTYFTPIAQYLGNAWYVLDEYYVKFSGPSLSSFTIDGGDISPSNVQLESTYQSLLDSPKQVSLSKGLDKRTKTINITSSEPTDSSN